MSIERFSLKPGFNPGEPWSPTEASMEVDPTGEYVKLADVVALVKRKAAEYEQATTGGSMASTASALRALERELEG